MAQWNRHQAELLGRIDKALDSTRAWDGGCAEILNLLKDCRVQITPSDGFIVKMQNDCCGPDDIIYDWKFQKLCDAQKWLADNIVHIKETHGKTSKLFIEVQK